MTTLSDVIGNKAICSSLYAREEEHLLSEAKRLLGINTTGTLSLPQQRSFQECFGIKQHVAVAVWWMIKKFSNNKRIAVHHLLWALMYLKQYGSEGNMARQVGVSRPTFRAWVDVVLLAIERLDSVVVSTKLCLLVVLIYISNITYYLLYIPTD